MSDQASTPFGGLPSLRAEVELEAGLARSGETFPSATDDPYAELVDPDDVIREEVGLASIRDAIDVLEAADPDVERLS